MTCATSTLKFTALMLNLLCCLAGGLMLSAGTYALAVFEVSDVIRIPCVIGIVLGSCLLIATILGCCGAFRESIRMTWIYALILLLLMLTQIGMILWKPVNFHKLATETIDNAWNREIKEPGTMAKYEIKFLCCGKNGPSDYADSGLSIPASCYRNKNSTEPIDLYTEGCVNQLTIAFEQSSYIENISDWSLVGIEAITILLNGMLVITMRNAERRKMYH